ncbi:hypothetical protein DV702_01220 [Sporosarcina sp. PTS2304]|uniref:hypothetical protein n=1 Tax=Sporosarcina sp. PTS2304 TaxID=2283194 RepID=UPI000E0D077B|nr:hypothetical protein [Sporosarcina sp. PTS2304]AXH98446.1 hypothetical protein DV702_01220 [Sporosarcina sp. PTS2304]
MVTMPSYEDQYANESGIEVDHKIEHAGLISSFLHLEDYLNTESNYFLVEGLERDPIEKSVFNILNNIEKRDSLDKDYSSTLPNELLANYNEMMNASKRNPLKILSTNEEQLAYILKMEKVYNRSTQEHISFMRAKEYEGSVEERTWYNIARQLKRNGVLPELEV